VVIGDVSGKGIPAALFMAVTVTLLRTLARQFGKPEEILCHLNDELAAQNPRGMFVTMACLVFDLRTGRVTCSNGGHNSPLLVGPSGEPKFVFPSTGMVLGLFPDRPYTSAAMDLAPGDTLLLYTDGVTEAYNPEEKLFEDGRLLECFADGPGPSPSETVAKLLSAVQAFAAGAAQSDDITILAVRRSPAGRAGQN
jgi:phosphoserine phosphatase RsbU/P